MLRLKNVSVHRNSMGETRIDGSDGRSILGQNERRNSGPAQTGTSTEFELGLKIGLALGNTGSERVLRYLVKQDNKPTNHKEMVKAGVNSKFGVSYGIIRAEELLEQYFEDRPVESGTLATVNMLRIRGDYFDAVKDALKIYDAMEHDLYSQK